MKFLVDGKQKQISLRRFSHQSNKLSPDLFDDLETDFPAAHARAEGSSAIVCTAAEYTELVEWWTQETDAYNARKSNNWFVEQLSAEERAAEYAAKYEFMLVADPL